MTALRAAAAILAAAASLGAAGCAPKSYAGIPLTEGAADPELQQLAHEARTGSAHAQLELGIRYEEGIGVERSFKRAAALYRQAATSTGGFRQAYSPAGNGRKGSVVAVSGGRGRAGLDEAKQRLWALERRLGQAPSLIF